MFSSNGAYLEKILSEFAINCQISLKDEVRHLVNDSREVKPYDVFCAVQGTEQKGELFIAQAIEQGCELVLLECGSESEHGKLSYIASGNKQISQISFYKLNQQLFKLAKAFYQNPQSKLNMIGITGTNGKTSTSQMVAKLLGACQQRCAVIGTNGAGNVEHLMPIANTTPGATHLHQLLNDFKKSDCQSVAMEVSSHALDQGRVNASLFDIAVFTNLSRDHLDYHQSMENYAAAKQQLFSKNSDQVAVINGDDKQAQAWLSNWPTVQQVIVYGRSIDICQYKRYVQAVDIKHHQTGTSFTLKTEQSSSFIDSPLLGDFNVDNLLAAIAVLLTHGIKLDAIATAVKFLTPVAGRMEVFSADEKATAIVDYAHTPDALKNALLACRQHCKNELWVVFGCGGDRDKGKRAQMGVIAEQLSDHTIITNDNPRSENPEEIAQDILSGCKNLEKITTILDRQQAVLTALATAKPKDVVLLAGKGHENYIIIGSDAIPYNERELVRKKYLIKTNSTAEAKS